MESSPILFLFLAFAAGALLAFFWSRKNTGNDQNAPLSEAAERLAAGQAELAGRLSQLAEAQSNAQGTLAEKFQAQERALSKSLEDRLADVSRRVGESLEKTSEKSKVSLGELSERLAVIDAAQKNIHELSKEVVGLQDILSNKQARGAFGEEQLESLIRDQLPPPYYEFQATLSNRSRVDCLIKLPPPLGPLSIDAKFPREAYDALVACNSKEEGRPILQRAFATSIMKHVRDIAEKYIIPGETAEAALMFVPSEAVYMEIYSSDNDIADKARRARVFIVSPTTLWAVLNTMRAVTKDVRMREQAHVIQKEVHTLLDDIVRLVKRVDNLDSHFHLAEKDLREIRISSDKIVKRSDAITSIEMAEEDNGPASLLDKQSASAPKS